MCGRAALVMQMTIGDDMGGASLSMSPNQPYSGTSAFELDTYEQIACCPLGVSPPSPPSTSRMQQFSTSSVSVRSLITRVTTL